MDSFYRYCCRFSHVIVSKLVVKSSGHKVVFAVEANLD